MTTLCILCGNMLYDEDRDDFDNEICLDCREDLCEDEDEEYIPLDFHEPVDRKDEENTHDS
jgi:hypothetical protein